MSVYILLGCARFGFGADILAGIPAYPQITINII